MVNIAMWSGPRNLSTAMMYAFAARSDCDVWDEPFYAAYLNQTGLDHPMRNQIIASGQVDPDKVALACQGQAPSGQAHFYQKHMTHHMVQGVTREWFSDVKHVFLIRHPARVLASYAVKRENPTLLDIGFIQQVQIFEDVLSRSLEAIVIDSYDIRQNPIGVLGPLCEKLGLDWDPQMLSWSAGGHPRDGVWATHWYDAVHRSTGFAGAEGPLPKVPESLQPVLQKALPIYEQLRTYALVPATGEDR